MPVLEHFRSLSEPRFLAIYQALTEKGYGPLDAEVAKLLKFRPQAIKKIPLEKRARLAKSWIEQKHNAELSDEEVVFRIVEVGEDEVVLDANHPLAGETVTFALEVKAVE